MSGFEIKSKYSTLNIDAHNTITLKAKSTFFRPVSFTVEEIDHIRFRKVSDAEPGYISFHMNDGRVYVARFTKDEKNFYRQFFLTLKDLLLEEPNEPVARATESSELNVTKTITIPPVRTEEPTIQIPTVGSTPSSSSPNLFLFFGFLIGAIYALFLIVYYSGMSSGLVTRFVNLGEVLPLPKILVSAHALSVVFATVFAGIACVSKQTWQAFTAAILFTASGLLYIPYVFFVLIEIVLCWLGFRQCKTQLSPSVKKEKVHWVYALDALLAITALIACLSLFASSLLDARNAQPAYATTPATPTPTATSSVVIADGSTSAISSQQAFDAYRSFAIGSLEDEGASGASFQEVYELFGTPSTELTNNTGDAITTTYIWYDETLGEQASFQVTFLNQLAVGKNYTGFASLNTQAPITTADFEAISMDEATTYESCLAQYGQPDSESESVLNGNLQQYVSWAYSDGSVFSITFLNGVASEKSSYGLQ